MISDKQSQALSRSNSIDRWLNNILKKLVTANCIYNLNFNSAPIYTSKYQIKKSNEYCTVPYKFVICN